MYRQLPNAMRLPTPDCPYARPGQPKDFSREQEKLLKKNKTLVHFFVRTDIDQYNLCPAFINKIENEAVLERNPERPETFKNPAQRMGFQAG